MLFFRTSELVERLNIFGEKDNNKEEHDHESFIPNEGDLDLEHSEIKDQDSDNTESLINKIQDDFETRGTEISTWTTK